MYIVRRSPGGLPTSALTDSSMISRRRPALYNFLGICSCANPREAESAIV